MEMNPISPVWWAGQGSCLRFTTGVEQVNTPGFRFFPAQTHEGNSNRVVSVVSKGAA